MDQPRQQRRPKHGKEPIKRLSVNLPLGLHTRFKAACRATNRHMVSEMLGLVERRTAELEGEARVQRASDDPTARRAEVLERALACNHPTGDIEEMLADMERGRGLPRTATSTASPDR